MTVHTDQAGRLVHYQHNCSALHMHLTQYAIRQCHHQQASKQTRQSAGQSLHAPKAQQASAGNGSTAGDIISVRRPTSAPWRFSLGPSWEGQPCAWGRCCSPHLSPHSPFCCPLHAHKPGMGQARPSAPPPRTYLGEPCCYICVNFMLARMMTSKAPTQEEPPRPCKPYKLQNIPLSLSSICEQYEP